MMPTSRRFAQNLKSFREKAELTQSALAHKLGVSEVTVQNWENERRWPAAEAFDHLAKSLNKKPWQFLLLKDDRASDLTREVEAIRTQLQTPQAELAELRATLANALLRLNALEEENRDLRGRTP